MQAVINGSKGLQLSLKYETVTEQWNLWSESVRRHVDRKKRKSILLFFAMTYYLRSVLADIC